MAHRIGASLAHSTRSGALEALEAMEMYEERPPEIFTGGYFDQA